MKTADNQMIAEAYRKRLKEVAGFKYVPEPIPMRNSKNAVVYYLFFASPNETGAKIVGEIFGGTVTTGCDDGDEILDRVDGSTWNPVTGCTKISAGCRNCYAERMARRLQGMGQPNYRNGFRVTMHLTLLIYPTWKNPRTIFVNSMSDLFHEKVLTVFIQKIFSVMVKAKWHRFQVLTKRSERLLELSTTLPWTRNIWMG
jgi:hypothetical protein